MRRHGRAGPALLGHPPWAAPALAGVSSSGKARGSGVTAQGMTFGVCYVLLRGRAPGRAQFDGRARQLFGDEGGRGEGVPDVANGYSLDAVPSAAPDAEQPGWGTAGGRGRKKKRRGGAPRAPVAPDQDAEPDQDAAEARLAAVLASSAVPPPAELQARLPRPRARPARPSSAPGSGGATAPDCAAGAQRPHRRAS